MPAAPSHEWEETETAVIVKVCRRGLPRGNHDMLSTDVLLKISASPYLLLLDLFGDVDSAATTAILSEEIIVFTLQKKTPGIWGRLTAQGSKADIVRRREASMEAAFDRLRAEDAARAESRRQAAMNRVDQKYQKIESGLDADIAAHDARMARTQQDLSQWKSNASQPTPPAAEGAPDLAEWQRPARNGAKGDGSEDSSDSDSEPAAPDHPDYHGRGWQPSKAEPKPKQLPAADAAAAAASAGGKSARREAFSTDSSDSDDEGRSRQPLKELSTRREPAPAEPHGSPPPVKPAPRSCLPSIKVEFTDINKEPGVPARTKLPYDEPKAAPPKEKKLEIPLLSAMS